MADKSFGVKELNLLNASGTPTVTSPNNLNLNANTVAISTSATVGNNLTVTSTTNSTNLNVTGIGTLTRGFATDLSVSGISTISQPSNANPHSLWDVVNNGSSAYRFTGPGQSGDENNPNIYLVRGQRYIFKVNASGHPFQLRVANGGAAYSDGVTNNGAQSGNVVINVQHDAPAQLYYQCTNHGGMVGNIYIVGGPQVISGVVTATTFSGSGASLTNLPAANLTGTLPAISGANLTSLPAQATIANNADNRVITGGSGVNLNGESGLLFTGTNLGIGNRTSSPDQLLHVHTSSGDAVIHVEAAADPKLRLRAHSGESIIQFADASSSNTGEINYVHSGDYLKFRVNASEALRIDSSGHVMIGTTTEGFATYGDQLTIANTGHCGMTIRSGTSNYGTIYFSDGDDGSADEVRGFIDYNHSNNQLQIGTNAATRLRINTSGTITTPHQFHIEVQRSGNQTGYDGRSSAGGTPVVFNDVVRTRGTANSALNTSTGKITVPVDGVYFLEASAYTTSGNTLSQGWFTEGSSRMTYSDITQHTNTDQIQAHGMHYLSANTEVGFHPYGATASSITIAANIYHTWFRVTLIG